MKAWTVGMNNCPVQEYNFLPVKAWTAGLNNCPVPMYNFLPVKAGTADMNNCPKTRRKKNARRKLRPKNV